MIKELVTYIATQASLTVGSTIEAGPFRQDSGETCIAVIESGGLDKRYATGKTGETSQRWEQMVQIISRAPTYQESRTAALAVFAVLQKRGTLSLPVITTGFTYSIESVASLPRPQHTGQDPTGRFLFTFNPMLHVLLTL
jgi:hypothetical protein